MQAKQVTYQQLSEQLDSVLAELQAEDLDVDRALELYKQGRELVAELEGRLKTAEHSVQKLKTITK